MLKPKDFIERGWWTERCDLHRLLRTRILNIGGMWESERLDSALAWISLYLHSPPKASAPDLECLLYLPFLASLLPAVLSAHSPFPAACSAVFSVLFTHRWVINLSGSRLPTSFPTLKALLAPFLFTASESQHLEGWGYFVDPYWQAHRITINIIGIGCWRLLKLIDTTEKGITNTTISPLA